MWVSSSSVACERHLPQLCRIQSVQPGMPAGPGESGHCSSPGFPPPQHSTAAPFGVLLGTGRSAVVGAKATWHPYCRHRLWCRMFLKSLSQERPRAWSLSIGSLTSQQSGQEDTACSHDHVPFSKTLPIHSHSGLGHT